MKVFTLGLRESVSLESLDRDEPSFAVICHFDQKIHVCVYDSCFDLREGIHGLTFEEARAIFNQGLAAVDDAEREFEEAQEEIAEAYRNGTLYDSNGEAIPGPPQ